MSSPTPRDLLPHPRPTRESTSSPAVGVPAPGTPAAAEKHASALAQFPADNSGSLEVGLFLQKMNISGGDGEKGLVGYILKFV
mgnify:CR=1 FL=1